MLEFGAMGADVIAKGRYECSHGCQIGGYCPGHEFRVWYREGAYYIQRSEADYRDALCIDSNWLDAIIEAMAQPTK